MAIAGERMVKFSSILPFFLIIIEPALFSNGKILKVGNVKHDVRPSGDAYSRGQNHLTPSSSSSASSSSSTGKLEHLSLPGNLHAATTYESLSVVVETNGRRQQRFIQVQSSPSIYPPHNLLVIEYDCVPGEILGVEVDVWTVYDKHILAARHHWKCNEHSKQTRKIFQRLTLPDSMVYRPDFLNRDVQIIQKTEVSVWILGEDLFKKRRKNYYELADAKARYIVNTLPLFSRPRKQHERFVSLPWGTKMMLKHDISWRRLLTCKKEDDVVDLMKFPIALPSMHHGLFRAIPEFHEPGRRLVSEANRNQPKFTISLVLYVLEHCQQHLCSILHRKTKLTNKYVTPLLFLNNEGGVFIQVEQEDGVYSSMLNRMKFPIKQWLQLIYVQNGRKWSIHLYTQGSFRHKIEGRSTFSKDVRYNESEAFYHLGGSDAVQSFSGYLHNAKLWRDRTLHPDEVPKTPFSELNYTSDIVNYYKECDALQGDLETVFNNFRIKVQENIKKKSCLNTYPLFRNVAKRRHLLPRPSCKVWQQPVPPSQQELWHLLQRAAVLNASYAATHEWLSHQLYEGVLRTLESRGLGALETMVPWMMQAGCYGNQDAVALLATVYADGLGVNTDESKALLYWLVSAQRGSGLAMLALAYRHHTGLDEKYPQDLDYAYRYYYQVATDTVLDRSKHAADDITFEAVRLTDSEQLKLQTGEKGDYFKWLKYQAKQGVADAQLNLARMYYHGAAGVPRDVGVAADLYRMNAQQNPLDPVAQFDYSVILIRGQGVEKNVTKGMEYLNKSAELGHGPAFTAIGWYKLNLERNDTEAAHYFEKGDRMGHRDAAHNLGFMHLTGRYPGKAIDRGKAFVYYLKAAEADHWDSAVKVSSLYNEGNANMTRDVVMATAWARYVAENHQDVAWALRRGLDSYMKGSWSQSLVYYAMAGQAGLEVAHYNLALLCEENQDDVARMYVGEDCAMVYWKLAAQAAFPHITSTLKMADHHWYGQNKTDRDEAIQYYIQAAKTKNPQAIFNLAYLLENGVAIPEDMWKSLRLSSRVYNSTDNVTRIAALYRMCRDGSEDGFLPCGLALLNLQARQLWEKHTVSIKMASAITVGILTVLAFLNVFVSARSNSSATPTTSDDATDQQSSDNVSEPHVTDNVVDQQNTGDIAHQQNTGNISDQQNTDNVAEQQSNGNLAQPRSTVN